MLCALAACTGAAYLAGASWIVQHATERRTYSDLPKLPRRRVALVLGCSPMAGAYPNPYFANRIEAAIELFHAGKADYLLVSGDNHRLGYNEPEEMKAALIRGGIPPDRIYCDYAGLRTLDSVVRAKQIFGQESILIVSQKFHNERAIFIARKHGIDAIGYNARDVDARTGFTTNCRELLARANVMLDLYVFHRSPKFLGSKIEIADAAALPRSTSPSLPASTVPPASKLPQ